MSFVHLAKLLFLGQIFIWSLPSLALPKYDRTILPIPPYVDPNDARMIQEVLKLQVYQDHEDANQYYFVPPFHIRQYSHGAASHMSHGHTIKKFAEANTAIKERIKYMAQYNNERILELERQILVSREQVNLATQKLEEAVEKNNARIIEIREKALAREEELLEKNLANLQQAQEIINNGGILMPALMRKTYYEDIIMTLSQTGINVPYTGHENEESVFVTIKETIQELSASYGGNLAFNVYGGFTQEQVDALQAFKTKYMPYLKVSLLPIEQLTFFSLTEWQNDPNAWSYSSKMFRNITGAGDYLGAAIVMDTSVAGALSLAEHLQPFVLPVGIKATFKQAAEPTEAILSCDFTTGYEVKGRADVRDGLIVYDNDITNTISSNDFSHGACDLTYISGDRSSAAFKALEAMEREFENMRIHRTYLSHAEKKAYHEAQLEDIQNNRREDEPTYTQVIRKLDENGWHTVVVEGLTRAADFHWHTNIQDVSHVSDVKFTKHIYIAGHEIVTRDMPTNLCLVYSKNVNAYDRCTNAEQEKALNMQRASLAAASTPACSQTTDPFECGRRRDDAGLTQREGDTTPVDDAVLVNAIH